MATYNNSCGAILILIALLTLSYGFNANTAQTNAGGQHRTRRMPPLFYTDIEPEIRAITIPRPVIDFNVTSIANNLDVAGSSISITTKKKSVSKKKTKNLKKSSVAKKSSPHKEKKTHEAVWHRHYSDLLQYKEEYGNCLVPQNYPEDRKLGLWVMQQRRQYSLLQQEKNSSLSGKRGVYRRQLLEQIGFVWRLDRRGPRGSYGSLRRTTLLTGHEIHTVANFEHYMLEEGADYTEDQKRGAWLKRFEILH